MAKLLIIADDFTGGLDTGVKFAQRGINVRVILNPDTDVNWNEAEVLVAVTESRRLEAGEAWRVVYKIASAGRRNGIRHIYKKTDSALRGNVGAELSAVLQASGAEMLPFLPAYPDMGRTTSGGKHYINDKPVSESVFAADPFNPVTESNVCRLIALQTDIPAWHTDRNHLKSGSGICVIDAQSDMDLKDAGRQLMKMNGLPVSAGCAGFAEFLPSILEIPTGSPPLLPNPGEGLLVICGSMNPITQKQMDWAQGHGFARLPPSSITTASAIDRWMIVDANAQSVPFKIIPDGKARRSVEDALAEALVRLEPLAHGPILLTGGDTLMRCLKRLDCREIKPILELYPGVVLSSAFIVNRERLIISKSGGFGEETLLTDLQSLIMNYETEE